MNPEHKKYILENADKMPIQEISRNLGIKERYVKKVLRMEGGKAGLRKASLQDTTPDAIVKAPVLEAVSPAPLPKTAPLFNNKIGVLISIALIIILGLAVYANSLNGKFVYDDENLIKNNASIKNLFVLPNVFIEDMGKGEGKRSPFYRPLQIITYALDYRLWKLNVVGYHLTNVMLHIFVALCIYWLINIIFGDTITSILTAALFVVHPIHTTVVSYISTRAESLYLLFMLIAFIFYIKASNASRAPSSRSPSRVTYYIVMLSSYSLSLLSKESALILPVLIILYHYTFKEKIRGREFASVICVSLLYIILRITVLRYLITDVEVKNTLSERVPGFFVAVATYARLLFLPFGLHMEYGAKLFRLADTQAIAGLVILAALLFLIKRTWANRLIFFSLSWFIITLLPVSNLYPLNAYMSENWLYLPSIGIFLLLAGLLAPFFKKEKARITVIIFTSCIIVFYSVLSIKQNYTWTDPIRFYERTLKYASDSSRVYNNLANAYKEAGRSEEAINMYKKAIEFDPEHDHASYTNLGNVYSGMGKKDYAIRMYKKAIELNPNHADAYNNLGVIYYKNDKKEDSIAMYKKAIELNPNYADAYNNIAVAYSDMGKKEDAFAMYKKAIALNPDYAEPYINLGDEYSNLGKKEDAIFMYKKAIEIDSQKADAYNNLANVYDDTGRKEDAILMYKKAIEINPMYADAYYNIGITYRRMNRREEAIAAFKKALEINPNHEDARRNLEALNGVPK